MRNFQQIGAGTDVMPLMMSLQRQPDLWGADPIRTTFPSSPHAEVDDILLRFEDLKVGPDHPDIERHVETAERTWREAWNRLPEAKTLILPLMARVGAYELARVLITRLPPGGTILPHADTRGTYANLPDIARYHVVLQGLPGSIFNCGAESVQMRTGETWWFNAHAVHSCVNNSADDRIHMLVDVRLMR